MLTIRFILISLLLSLSIPLQAQETHPDKSDVSQDTVKNTEIEKSLYTSKGCVACHGVDGNTPLAPNYPKIAGQNFGYIINQLNAFKSGTRKNGMAAVMTGIVSALSDDDMQKLASYLSQSSTKKTETKISWPSCKAWCVGGMGEMLGMDSKDWKTCKEWCLNGMPELAVASEETTILTDTNTLYFVKACIACHGANGKTPVMDVYPKIAGQSESYLLAQMKDIKAGIRNNSHSIAMTNIMNQVSDEDMASIARWLSEQTLN